MPHVRQRYLEPIAKKMLTGSKIVGVIGQRQTGKTTLVERISADYVTLDDPQTLETALKTPQFLISNRKLPFGIDECQESPPLFSTLKEWVRTHRTPGQFILTGSVRFTSIEEIRESLTGRMVDIELLPLTLSELEQLPLWDILRLVQSKNPLDVLKNNPFAPVNKLFLLKIFLLRGGLPGICFVRSEAMRSRQLRSHIKTILDRDLRKVTNTQLDYLTLKTFLEEVALQQGDVFDLSKVARTARIAPNTAKKILAGLESVFLVRSILKMGNTSGRLVYLEDQGMATFLLQERGISLLNTEPRIADWNRFLFQQLYGQLNYRMGTSFQIFSYRPRGGALIDFGIRIDGHDLGYSVGMENTATSQQFKSAESFIKKHPRARVFLLHQGESFRKITNQIYECPLRSVV